MAYSAEVIRRARERLAQAKADRESENLHRLLAAYEQVPRLKEIDLELRKSMVQAARTVYAQSSDVRAAMEEVKNANLALQRERADLVRLHFGGEGLAEEPICGRCGGSGYVGANMCQCLLTLCREEQKKELSLLSGGMERFEQFRLDYYSDRYDNMFGASPRAIMERNFDICRRYATTFSGASGNLLFIGNTGLGKTLLSACIAGVVADRGYSVCYETASRLFGKLERARFSGDEEARRECEKYQSCDLLIIDDLGTEMPGQFVTAALYSLLNDRLMEKKPMVVSTNLNVDEVARRYSPQIASRMKGEFARLTFVGEDIRVMNK